MKASGFCVVLAILAIALITATATATDWYVDAVNGSDETGDGSAGAPWKSMTFALDNTTGTQEDPAILHIATGTYSPSATGDTFPLRTLSGESYRLLGAGYEKTIIDAEQTCHVFHCSGYIGDYIEFNGLTVTGGSPPATWIGGGILITDHMDADIMRCRITGNTGNSGIDFGGVLTYGTLTITDSIISDNYATHKSGGGIRADFSYLHMKNCLIVDNSCDVPSEDDGGGVNISSSDTTMVNCTVVGNEPNGVWLHQVGATATLTNCILWNNGDDIYTRYGEPPTISHCNISDGDGLGENGNISQDPLFVTGAQGDYYLSHAGVNSKKKEKRK